MEQGFPGNKPVSLITVFAPYLNFLWRLLVSIGLIGLALIISG